VPPRVDPASLPKMLLVPKAGGKRCLGIYRCGCRSCYHMDIARAIAHNALVQRPVGQPLAPLYPWSDPPPTELVVLPPNLRNLRDVPLPVAPHIGSKRARDASEEKFPRAQQGELDEGFPKKARPSKRPKAIQNVYIEAPQAPQDGEAPEAVCVIVVFISKTLAKTHCRPLCSQLSDRIMF
jgi:hypothetical protein